VRIGLDVLTPLALKSIAQGAATQCYVATNPAVAANGEYFLDCNVGRSSRKGADFGLARQLWDVSERIAREL
jgi:WW domain-containing oxidoreductase